MKTKILSITAIMLIMLSVMATAISTSNDEVSYLKARTHGKSLVVTTYIKTSSDSSGIIEAYCSHDNKTILIDKETYKTGNHKKSAFLSAKNTSCVKGDKAWVVLNGVKSEEVTIKKRNKQVTQIPVPVLTPEETRLEECKTNAKARYDANPEKKDALRNYEKALNQCQEEYDETMCEKDETKEWKHRECKTKKDDHHGGHPDRR